MLLRGVALAGREDTTPSWPSEEIKVKKNEVEDTAHMTCLFVVEHETLVGSQSDRIMVI